MALNLMAERRGFLLDDKDEDIEIPVCKNKFFKVEDYQYLLSKTLNCPRLHEFLAGEEKNLADPNQKSRPKNF